MTSPPDPADGGRSPSRTVELRVGELPREAGLVAVPVRPDGIEGPAEKADRRLRGALERARKEGSLPFEEGGSRLFPTGDGSPHVLAIGVGDGGPPDPRWARRAGGLTVRRGRKLRLASVALALPGGVDARSVGAAAEGLMLGDWTCDELRSVHEDEGKPPAPPPSRAVIGMPAPVEGADEAARRGRLTAEAQNWARRLVALPANVVTPRFLEERARELAGEYGLRVEAWAEEELRERGFGALLAVARGSREPPRFLIVEHRGGGGPPAVLVGKGVTFDSGGLSLKSASGMESMKYDMAGAAAVLGALRAVAALELRRRVVALVPCAENMPSGSALRPGDVIRGLSGRSIEVVNTDAEGRLLLSDALTFGARMEPVAMVDVATLTGACVVALGRHAIGLMTTDDGLAEGLLAAGERADERAWRLPLWDEYRSQLDSEIADIKNAGGREAGVITAAAFLRPFAEGAAWAHLDIAGTAWAEKEGPFQPEGATGVGVRLLVEWLSGEA